MATGSGLLEGLNPAQKGAVETIAGPLLIVAGPGSGKTRVITTKIVHLLQQGGLRPQQVLAVTFTNKAAGEMRARVRALLGGDRAADQVMVRTFHAVSYTHLRAHETLR